MPEQIRGYRGSGSFGPVSTDLLVWFDRHGRDLPWRRTRQPWPILVSELMLQQTQVSRVAYRWPRFLDRFPSPAACAGATVADVIDEWSGLGYNRRAVNLHRASTAMVEHHGGTVPGELSDLLALPGVGPYTARAVRVFALGLDDGVLDTNVARILARSCGRRLKPAEAQRLADQLVPRGQGWRWNQALLDLGASRCTARNPGCGGCPLATECSWHQSGNGDPDPAQGSAGVSGRQSTFVGSDRQGRGRLVSALRAGPIAAADAARLMGWPEDPDRADRVLTTLVDDGLVQFDGSSLLLPD